MGATRRLTRSCSDSMHDPNCPRLGECCGMTPEPNCSALRPLVTIPPMTPEGGRRFHGPRDYLDLAESPTATTEELRLLGESPYSFVLEAVAQHPSTPADVLDRLLARNPGNTCLHALAIHPSASRELLAAIAVLVPPLLHQRDAYAGFAAGIALFSHPNAPDEALLELLDHPQATKQFRKVAARETNHPAALERLRRDRSEVVRRAAARRKSQPHS
jgi:hypothetical protein